MCTLIVAASMWKSVPLLVAANRDEQLDRPSEGPSLWENNGVRVLAPKDLKAGGTWMGVNALGLFVAITNRYTPEPREDLRSRGQLVVDVLRMSTAQAAATAVAMGSASHYNPYHLVVGDTASAHLVWNDGKQLHRHRLQPGMHAITERSMDAAPSQRLERLPAMLKPMAGPGVPSVAELKAVLSHRDEEHALEGVTVHDESRNYGTRSASIVSLSADPDRLQFMHADGPPHEADFDDHSDALRKLLRAG